MYGLFKRFTNWDAQVDNVSAVGRGHGKVADERPFEGWK
jgi:hypothetical protein